MSKLINITTVAKPKGTATGSGSGGSRTYVTTVQQSDEARHAQYADKAEKAELADKAQYADRSGQADRAAYADRSGQAETLAEGSAVWGKFLRKDADDATPHKIGVGSLDIGKTGKGLDRYGNAIVKTAHMEEGRTDDLRSESTYTDDWLGAQGYRLWVDKDGRSHLVVGSIRATDSLETMELRFNRIDVVSGEQWNTMAYGVIKKVDTLRKIAYVDLVDGELLTVHVDDILRGQFHNLTGGNATSNGTDDCGFPRLAGFRTCYFSVRRLLEDGTGFHYSLREGSPDPCAGMKFAAYGNFTDTARQSATFSTRTRLVMLAGVSTWQINPDLHYRYVRGDLEGLHIWGHDFHGHGTIQLNSYIMGSQIFFTPEQEDQLKGEDAYAVELSSYEGTVKITADGELETAVGEYNVVAGEWNVTVGEQNVTARGHRLATLVQAFKGSRQLYYAGHIERGTFTVSLVPMGCTAEVSGGAVLVTSISDAEHCKVEITVNCEGEAVYSKTYRVNVVRDGKQGPQGPPGTAEQLESMTIYYKVSALAAGENIAAGGWQPDEAPPTSEQKPYLWCYEHYVYKSGKEVDSPPYVKTQWVKGGDPGADGKDAWTVTLQPDHATFSTNDDGEVMNGTDELSSSPFLFHVVALHGDAAASVSISAIATEHCEAETVWGDSSAVRLKSIDPSGRTLTARDAEGNATGTKSVPWLSGSVAVSGTASHGDSSCPFELTLPWSVGADIYTRHIENSVRGLYASYARMQSTVDGYGDLATIQQFYSQFKANAEGLMGEMQTIKENLQSLDADAISEQVGRIEATARQLDSVYTSVNGLLRTVSMIRQTSELISMKVSGAVEAGLRTNLLTGSYVCQRRTIGTARSYSVELLEGRAYTLTVRGLARSGRIVARVLHGGTAVSDENGQTALTIGERAKTTRGMTFTATASGSHTVSVTIENTSGAVAGGEVLIDWLRLDEGIATATNWGPALDEPLVNANLLTALADGYASLSSPLSKGGSVLIDGRTATAAWHYTCPDGQKHDLLTKRMYFSGGKSYTLSMWMKGTASVEAELPMAEGMRMAVDGEEQNGATFQLDGSWHRYTVVWTIPASGDTDTAVLLRLPSGQSGATLNVGGVKLEQDGRATRPGLEGMSNLADALLATGLDIEQGLMLATADNFRIQNNRGEQTFAVDADGNITGKKGTDGKYTTTVRGRLDADGGTIHDLTAYNLTTPFSAPGSGSADDPQTLLGYASDNVLMSSSGTYNVPHPSTCSGRRLNLYTPNQGSANVRVRDYQTSKLFYEYGVATDVLALSCEMVTIVSTGSYWLVTARTDIAPRYHHGIGLNALWSGEVRSTSKTASTIQSKINPYGYTATVSPNKYYKPSGEVTNNGSDGGHYIVKVSGMKIASTANLVVICNGGRCANEEQSVGYASVLDYSLKKDSGDSGTLIINVVCADDNSSNFSDFSLTILDCQYNA